MFQGYTIDVASVFSRGTRRLRTVASQSTPLKRKCIPPSCEGSPRTDQKGTYPRGLPLHAGDALEERAQGLLDGVQRVLVRVVQAETLAQAAQGFLGHAQLLALLLRRTRKQRRSRRKK